MTKPNPSYASESGSGDSVYHAVFIDTNLDTHLLLIVSDTETVSDLKNKIVQEHPILFPNHGEIRVNAVKVKCRGNFYCLCDSIPLSTAFIGVKKNWFLSIEASSNVEICRNQNALNSHFEKQLTPLAMYNEVLKDKDDLKIVPYQRSDTEYEVPSTSRHSKHIDVITSQVSPRVIGKGSDHLEQGTGVVHEVNASGSSFVGKESNHLEQGAELSKRENDVVIGAPTIEAIGMDVNETSCENIYKTVVREHAQEETDVLIKETNVPQSSLDTTGAGEHRRKRKRKKSAKTVNAVGQKPVMSDTETIEGFAGVHSKIELQKDINGIQAGDKCEIGDNHASQNGGQEKHIIGTQAKSGVEHVNEIGLMDGVEEKEASHDKKDHTKKKTKKRRTSEEKNLLNTETKVSGPTSRDLSYADGTGFLDHTKEKEALDNKEREGLGNCEVKNNMSQEGQEEIVAAHVKSGVRDVKETGLMDSIKEKEAFSNIQDHTRKKTKKKQSRKETSLNTELRDPDFASKNLLIAEDLTANQVDDKCERGDNIATLEEQKETVVAASVESGQECGSLDHKKEKEASVIQEGHAKKKIKKRQSCEEKNILNTEVAVIAADGKSGHDHEQVPESLDQTKETRENKVDMDDSRDKKRKKSTRNSKKDLLRAGTSHLDYSGQPLHMRNDISTLDSSVVMAKEGKAETATPMSPPIDPGLETERASFDIDRAHTRANTVNAVSSLTTSLEGNTDGGPSQAVANSDAHSGDLKKKAGHHADELGQSDEINFRDYFVSGHPEDEVVQPGNLFVAEEIREAGVNNKLKLNAGRKKLDANANVSSSELSNSVLSGQPKRKAEVNSNEPSAAATFDLKVSQNIRRGNKDHLEVDRYHLAARKSSNNNDGETKNRPERKKSLLDTSNAIFKEDSTGSSEGPHGVEDSNASTRTPSDNILSDYSDGDSVEDENTSNRDAGGVDIKKSHSTGAKNLTMEAILRSSSRYKKAKLAASQSQNDDMESEPMEFVPDSQANI